MTSAGRSAKSIRRSANWRLAHAGAAPSALFPAPAHTTQTSALPPAPGVPSARRFTAALALARDLVRPLPSDPRASPDYALAYDPQRQNDCATPCGLMIAAYAARLLPQDFVSKWRQVDLSERSAVQQHFLDLCRPLTAGHWHRQGKRVGE